MKYLGILLFVVGLIFCIAAFAGHDAAYSGAAVCFCAAVICREVSSCQKTSR